MSSVDGPRIIFQARNLTVEHFHVPDDRLLIGNAWTEWLEIIERQFRYFRITNGSDKKDALIIYGAKEIARLEKTLVDPHGQLNEYDKLKPKLNRYFMPYQSKHYSRYLFLKMKPREGEAIIMYATRLCEKAQNCDFGHSIEDRTLEYLLQTIENQELIRNCIRNCWSLLEFLAEARLLEELTMHVNHMNEAKKEYRAAKLVNYLTKGEVRDNNVKPCGYCGISGMHPKGKGCPAYGKFCYGCRKPDHFARVCWSMKSRANGLNRPDKTIKAYSDIQMQSKAAEYTQFESYNIRNFAKQNTLHKVGHVRVKKIEKMDTDGDTSGDMEEVNKVEAKNTLQTTRFSAMFEREIDRLRTDIKSWIVKYMSLMSFREENGTTPREEHYNSKGTIRDRTHKVK